MNPSDVWECPVSETGKHHFTEVYDPWEHKFREKCLRCGKYTDE